SSNVGGAIPIDMITLDDGVLGVPLLLDASTATHFIYRYGPSRTTIAAATADGSLPVDTACGTTGTGCSDSDLIGFAKTHATGPYLDIRVETVNVTTGSTVTRVRVVTELAKETVLSASSFQGGISDGQLMADA